MVDTFGGEFELRVEKNKTFGFVRIVLRDREAGRSLILTQSFSQAQFQGAVREYRAANEPWAGNGISD
jgi:hypothetical protein